jgi:activating signal cointegrator 1
MRAISLWQPWATLLISGVKKIETRDWPLRYNGWLAIHAAKKWDRQIEQACLEPGLREAIVAADPHGRFAPQHWSRGAIVGMVNITKVVKYEDSLRHKLALTTRERACGLYEPGRWLWICNTAIAFKEPVPWKGSQGLFEVDEHALAITNMSATLAPNPGYRPDELF